MQYVCEIASRFFVLSFSFVVLSLTFGDVWKYRTNVKVDEKIMDSSPTAFFAYGHRKNKHPAILMAALSIVITQFLLYIVSLCTWNPVSKLSQGVGELSRRRSVYYRRQLNSLHDKQRAIRVRYQSWHHIGNHTLHAGILTFQKSAVHAANLAVILRK